MQTTSQTHKNTSHSFLFSPSSNTSTSLYFTLDLQHIKKHTVIQTCLVFCVCVCVWLFSHPHSSSSQTSLFALTHTKVDDWCCFEQTYIQHFSICLEQHELKKNPSICLYLSMCLCRPCIQQYNTCRYMSFSPHIIPRIDPVERKAFNTQEYQHQKHNQQI